jgi:hypothetical protein
VKALEDYLAHLYTIHLTGAAVAETSYYGALETLLNEVGKTLKPAVRCVLSLQNKGAGIPDGGLFTAEQMQKGAGAPLPGQLPARGVIEVKGTKADVEQVAESEQVANCPARQKRCRRRRRWGGRWPRCWTPKAPYRV